MSKGRKYLFFGIILVIFGTISLILGVVVSPIGWNIHSEWSTFLILEGLVILWIGWVFVLLPSFFSKEKNQ